MYQAYNFFFKSGNISINASQAIINTSQALTKIRTVVAVDDVPMQIMSQAQPEGAPSGSDSGNCLQLAQTFSGHQRIFSITSQWDPNSGLFGIFLLDNVGCSTPFTIDNSVALSPYIFTMSAKGLNFFTELGASSTGLPSNNPTIEPGFFEVNFNYGTKYGQGSVSNGITSYSTRLTANIPNGPPCRIASPDASWFTDYGDNKIRTAIVQITNNLDISNDRLSYIGSKDGIAIKYFPQIGALHLYASSGLTVQSWLSVLSNVIWQRSPNAPAIQPQDPPRQFTFSLGEGLTFNPFGPPANNYGPAVHYYLAIKLDNPMNSTTANSFAQSFCYPSFASDTNPSNTNGFLGQSVVKPGVSCDSGNYPRLTGYLPTIISSGENNFIRNTVFQMVYPQTQSGLGAIGSTTNPSSGQAWLGGWYDGSVFRWISGYELTHDKSGNVFAITNSSNLINPTHFSDSDGSYYSGLALTAQNYHIPDYLYFDIPSGTWSTGDLQPSQANFAIVEFGDNANASGNLQRNGSLLPKDEVELNFNLKLSQKASIAPKQFFESCQMTYSPSP